MPAIGGGRVAAAEILVATPAVRNIIREGKTHQLDAVIQTGAEFGMQSMDKTAGQPDSRWHHQLRRSPQLRR